MAKQSEGAIVKNSSEDEWLQSGGSEVAIACPCQVYLLLQQVTLEVRRPDEVSVPLLSLPYANNLPAGI